MTHVETLVIGGGQAGLAVAHQLQQRGRKCLVVDAHDRVGDAWRRRWDSLRLFTPAKYDGMPGMAFPAPRGRYPTKDETADFLEEYAERFALPVLTGVTVDRLDRDGRAFRAGAGARSFTAENVVIATGAYRTPRVPDFAATLAPTTTQLHSVDYRNPQQLPGGAVLVVGAANSGSEIAFELAGHREVWLSGRNPGQEPTRPGTVPDRLFTPVLWFAANHVLTVDTPIGRKARDHFLHPPRGIPLGRVRSRQLAEAGVRRVARVTGAAEGKPRLEDGTVLEVAAVVWCTGFDIDLSWVDLPLELVDGFPEQNRGVVDAVPGLYVVGLPFLRSLSSGLLGGVGRDAAWVAAHLDTRMRHRASTRGDRRPQWAKNAP